MSDFFRAFDAKSIHSSNIDTTLHSSENQNKLICLFLWGVDCPNCDIAKQALTVRKAEAEKFNLTWYHANIYEDFELATRFGLFGIPVFLFFYNGKKLGKISPFPGFEPFAAAIESLMASVAKSE